MIEQPFALFRPYAKQIDVRHFTKEDQLSDDMIVMATLGTAAFVTLDQVHGAKTIIVKTPSHRSQKADGAATTAKGLTLVMRTADCQPLLVYAPDKKMIGMIHAGWRGLVAGVIPSFFEAIRKEWNVEPKGTIVCIGPSLCTDCAEFTDPEKELPDVDTSFFHGSHVDLQGIADQQLDQLGIPHTQRERSPDCVKCKKDEYWSVRGGDAEAIDGNCRNMLTICLK